MGRPPKLKIMSQCNSEVSFVERKCEMLREGSVLIFVLSLKNWLLGQPIYVSIALDLYSSHSLLCLHSDSAQADFHPPFPPHSPGLVICNLAVLEELFLGSLCR